MRLEYAKNDEEVSRDVLEMMAANGGYITWDAVVSYAREYNISMDRIKRIVAQLIASGRVVERKCRVLVLKELNSLFDPSRVSITRCYRRLFQV